MTFSIIDEFSAIAEKAVTTPANTAQLMELQVFVKDAQRTTMDELNKKLANARQSLFFLMDHVTFTLADMNSNSETFAWIDRMPSILEEHRTIMDEKTAMFMEALKVGVISKTFPCIIIDEGS